MQSIIRVLIVLGGMSWSPMGFGAAYGAWNDNMPEEGVGDALLMTGGVVGVWLIVTTWFCGFILGPVWTGNAFEGPDR